MRKTLLFASLLMGGVAVAQNTGQLLQLKHNVAVPYSRFSKYDRHEGGTSDQKTEPVGQPKTTTNTDVGTSTYQLQTNSSVQNRILQNADGSISLGYSFSSSPNSTTWPDRGTGYVYYNGSTWSAAPSTRFEPVRTGWPSVMVLGGGKEVIVTHNTAGSNLYLSSRPSKGTGTWTNSATALASTAPFGNYWPRAVNGGTDSNTIHVISISNPVDLSNNPVSWNGQVGALTYSRSTDGGATWPVLHTIPTQHDSSQYVGFDGDAYDIDARGNVVAYVAGGFTNDLFLMKSTDNGSTWTKTVILAFPIPMFEDQLSDVTNDGIADTLETNDASVNIMLDDQDNAHVFFGNMRILNEDTTDNLISYFPGTIGLSHWTEGMAQPEMIAGMEDIDGDAALNVTDWGTYQVSLTSHPNSGMKSDNTIYLVYAALVENSDDGFGMNIRNIYYMESSDHGVTWNTPRRVMLDDFTEQVYPSVVPHASGECVSLVYQSDAAAGHGVGADNVDNGTNISETATMVYVCFDPLDFFGTETVNMNGTINIFPNPTADFLNISALDPIERVDIHTILGSQISSSTPNSSNVMMDVQNLTPGIYLVSVYQSNTKTTKRVVVK